MCWAEIWEISEFLIRKNSFFFFFFGGGKIFSLFEWACFRNAGQGGICLLIISSGITCVTFCLPFLHTKSLKVYLFLYKTNFISTTLTTFSCSYSYKYMKVSKVIVDQDRKCIKHLYNTVMRKTSKTNESERSERLVLLYRLISLLVWNFRNNSMLLKSKWKLNNLYHSPAQ